MTHLTVLKFISRDYVIPQTLPHDELSDMWCDPEYEMSMGYLRSTIVGYTFNILLCA
jgi:hypothetical protein